MLTRCPACATSFRITPAQLRARRGQVRCGQCRAIFDALDELADEEPAAPPPAAPPPAALPEPVPPPAQTRSPRNFVAGSALQSGVRAKKPGPPVMPEPAPKPAPPITAEPVQTAEAAAMPEPAPEAVGDIASVDPGPAPIAAAPVATPEADTTPDAAAQPAAADAPDTDMAELPEAPAELDQEPEVPRRRGRGLLWTMLILAMGTVLAGQAAIYWRAELAQKFPAARAALEKACAYLACTVGLPRLTAALSIDTSDMQFDGTRLRLSATLRNSAAHAQEWPNLYLTLTDTSDQAVLRRVLTPGDYLPPGQDVAAGFPPNGEIAVNLLLDTSGVAASGYRLYLFHP
ncbi:MAG: DUF3426 domain-containing protein [Rhodocyclaceae bacterium]|nr:DUF3426 domain-containing protein [Rhodocyclaceae bacterium]